MSTSGSTPKRHTQAWFTTTRWSVVLSAQQTDTVTSAQALEGLCQTYWYPLYAYVRRQGHSPEEAADLTQGFFTRLLEKDWLAEVDRQRGRFRNFLMASMKHFMSNERAKDRAKKRGGDKRIVSLDIEIAETQYRLEPVEDRSPEQIYERQWALTVLTQVLDSLRADYEQRGRAGQFDTLRSCLVLGSQQQPYADLAQKLDVSEGAVRVMVHRLKQQYRKTLRHHIAQTVATPEEVELEMQHLRTILAGS
jgi:RNA polymerase sigma-70 factor (ECF subfamily)